jgi:hypothetical protein
MPQYISHYSENTSLKFGVVARAEDILARSQLIREAGLHCVEEVWVQNYGFSPLYECDKVLTESEKEILCLTEHKI